MCYETKFTNLFIFKSVIIFVCSIQIETKIQELCDYICTASVVCSRVRLAFHLLMCALVVSSHVRLMLLFSLS